MTQGDYVSIEFSSANATVPSAVTLKDSNNVTRVLAANERLIIDRLLINVNSAAGLVTLFSDKNANGSVEAGERIAEFQDCVTPFIGGPEGHPCPIGITPSVLAAASGQVSINGDAHIVIGQSQGQYPAWQASRTTAGA